MKVDNMKKPILIITYGIILYFIVNNLNTFLGYINQGLKVLTPVIIGMVLAFIVNLFLRFYEREVFDRIFKKSKDKAKKYKRPVCVIVSYISFAAIIALIAVFIFPRISESLSTLKGNVPAYINSISQFLYDLTLEYQFTDDIWNKITENFGLIITNTSQFLNTALPKIFDVTKTVTSSVFSLFLGIVFSFYILVSKEKLVKIIKKIMYTHLKDDVADSIIEVFYRANKVFRSFVGGQLTEAVILGVLCYIGMIIFRMPYAPLVSVIIGLTSIVPVVGPFIGTVPCALLILLENPVMAILFVVFVIVLQQVEGNIIYPRVVGSAVGLSGFFVLIAVTVGGGLFGIPGILLGVPAMAVLYNVYGDYVNGKLREKEEKNSAS